VVSFTTRLRYPRGKSLRYPLSMSLGRPHSRSGRWGENSWLYQESKSNLSIIQPVTVTVTTRQWVGCAQWCVLQPCSYWVAFSGWKQG
jgi:hypothetical protein